MVKIELSKKDSLWVAFVIVLVGVGFVYAYGGNNPAVMGHSAGELEVSWNDIKDIPAGFADGIDDGDTSVAGCPVGYSLYYEGSEAVCLKDWTAFCDCSWDTRNSNSNYASFEARFENGVMESRITSCRYTNVYKASNSVSCTNPWEEGAVSCLDTAPQARISCTLEAGDPRDLSKTAIVRYDEYLGTGSWQSKGSCSCTYAGS